MIATAIKSHEPDTTTIKTSGSRFIAVDQFHSFEFGCAAQCACRKSGRQQLKWVYGLIYLSRHLTYKMYHVGIILNFPVLCYLHFLALPAKVVTRKIDKHYIFGIFFRVFKEIVCCTLICFIITSAPECSCNGMHDCFSVAYNKLRLG